MIIALGSDHTALEHREAIRKHLEEVHGATVLDLGPFENASCDYPVYGVKVAEAVVEGKADLGIAICGTGVGIGIAANKVRGIRCCTCSDPYTSRLSRMHNDSNVLTFGARVVGIELAKMIVDEWLNASYEGGRHGRRIDLITQIENEQAKL